MTERSQATLYAAVERILFRPTLAIWLLAVLLGCASQPGVSANWLENLTHEDPHIRLEAAYRAGRDNDKAAVPLLIARLEDDDPAVRLATNVALKKITDVDMGFKAYDNAKTRQDAVQRWRDWYEKEQAKWK